MAVTNAELLVITTAELLAATAEALATCDEGMISVLLEIAEGWRLQSPEDAAAFVELLEKIRVAVIDIRRMGPRCAWRPSNAFPSYILHCNNSP